MKHIIFITCISIMVFIISCNQERHASPSGITENGSIPSEIDHSDHDHEATELPANNNAADAEMVHEHNEGEGENEGEMHSDEDHGENHTLYTISRKPFSTIYKTSGIIMVDAKDEIIVTAKSHGIIRYEDHFLFPGVKLKAGTKIFSITGDNLTENNTSVNFSRVEADYLEARANFERAKSLIADRLITEEHYLSIENNFSRIKAEYNAYRESSGKEGSFVSAPADGYIGEIYITEGEIVAPGDRLARMIIRHKMVLKADVAPADMGIVEDITAANFNPGYSDKTYSTVDMNGSKISSGRSTGENSFYIPVFFSFDYNDELIPGSFADVWLLGGEKPAALLIPDSSILEEYGKFYVFVESEEGEFEKRYFSPGQSNGTFTEVLSGLNEGENIVSEGAYQVKMSMMTSLPSAHNHNH